MEYILMTLGLVLLIVGARILISGASSLALLSGLSPLVVGLTVVAYGTSAPEMAVSIQSAYTGQADMAIGNILGSNIFNVLFILGVSALIAPLVVSRQLVKVDIPIMVATSFLLLLFAWDYQIQFWEAAILVALCVLYTLGLIVYSRRQNAREKRKQAEAAQSIITSDSVAPTKTPFTIFKNVFFILAGLVLLVLGSEWFVSGAISLAKWFGVDDVIISLTIVAAGTSLPEVATSITATLKGERDLAVGNVIGSNIFNILAVAGFSGLASSMGLPVSEGLVSFDLLFMIAVALACLPIAFSGFTISRLEGAAFLFFYAAYTAYLILTAQQHPLATQYTEVIFYFIGPFLTVALCLPAVIFWWKAKKAA